MNNIEKLKQIIDNSKRIVVFSGAGISVPSGIPDFRSANGIFNKKLHKEFTPEQVVSHTYFMKYPKDFYEFYFDKMVYPNALPNQAHEYFAKLEEDGKNVTIVTQNIDGFHSMAGNKKVYELHGSIHRNYCMNCNKYYDLKQILNSELPKCSCGGIIKPDVVLYEEGLDESVIEGAVKSIYNADTLIIIGTSLMVYPAASFIRYFKGHNLILVNKSKTSADQSCSLVFYDDVINIINELKKI